MASGTDVLRLDLLLVARGLAPTRSKAQALIRSGQVYSGTARLTRPGQSYALDLPLSVEGELPFVSRAGVKLAGALGALGVTVQGRTCVDVGAATGGFTDCLLQNGARRVFAVDVGADQLDPRLRADARVTVMDRTNARNLTRESFPEPIELLTVDASFIGLEKLLPAFARVLAEGAELLALVKPQFEAGPEVAARTRGVIRDPRERAALIDRVRDAVTAHGFDLLGGADSVLPGPKGNVEHFLFARRAAPRCAVT